MAMKPRPLPQYGITDLAAMRHDPMYCLLFDLPEERWYHVLLYFWLQGKRVSRGRPFANPPLALTVLEIRYPELTDGAAGAAKPGVKSAVRERLPLAEYLTEETVELSMGAPASATVQRRTFPRFSSRDLTTVLQVKNNALILQTTGYGGWEESFRPLVEAALVALDRAGPPDGVLRIGLRYINEIRVPEIDSGPGNWQGYIHESLLSAADPKLIPSSLQPTVWQGIVQYRTADDSTLTVRYGPQEGYAVDPHGSARRKNPPAPGAFFLLDSDSFWSDEDEVPQFETGWILDRCDGLHAPIREFFGLATTEQLRNEVFDRQEEDTR